MLTLALAQIDVVPGRPDINYQTILNNIQDAKSKGVDILVFPEMALPGYLLADLWEQPAFLRDCEYYGNQVINASDGICIIFGNVAIDWNKNGNDGRPRKYNAIFVAQNKTLCGGENFPYPFRVKTLQPNYREFEDDRHFYAALKLAQELQENIEEFLTPINIVIKNQLLSLGCILCEDGWDEDYAVKPVQILKEAGANLIINASSSPFTLGKNNKRNRVFSEQAKGLGMPLIYINNVGLQNNGKTVYCFDGYSCVYESNGNIIAQCEPLKSQLKTETLQLPDLSLSTIEKPVDNDLNDSDIKSIYQALYYSGKKFLENIGMKKVVIGASGGIDSAVSAALYCDILGPENVLLVNMPSRYNSETTKDLAASLASNLKCLYAIVPIEKSVEITTAQLQQCKVRNLSTHQDVPVEIAPLVAENIQARDRSSRVLAAFAAAIGGGFTCNANKTELTVGYCTLYGDQAGFLAILADLWKHQVYALGEYLNKEVFKRKVIPQGVFDVVPSAELSDKQDVDAGQGDPLQYPYHDYLFKSFVEWWNPSSPEEILDWYKNNELEEKLGCNKDIVDQLFPTPRAFIDDLERWWKQFKGMGIAKRIQAPPIVAVSRRAFGFDYRESQNSVYFSREYLSRKEEILQISEGNQLPC